MSLLYKKGRRYGSTLHQEIFWEKAAERAIIPFGFTQSGSYRRDPAFPQKTDAENYRWEKWQDVL